MVDANVRARLLGKLSGQAHPYPTDRTILHLFEESAALVPESPAVTFNGTSLSYRELDQRANGAAEALQSRGVSRGDLVPLIVRNGLELPISVIALMKLGAPFVPIDDLWPAHRLNEMIQTIRPKVVLYADEDDAVTLLPDVLGLPIRADRIPERPQVDLGPGPTPDDLIYGFYTSGSTGAPKCALNAHRGLLNRFLYMTRRFGGSRDAVVLQNSRHVFDSSIWQLLWPLTIGAQVVVPRRGGVLDLASTVETIHRNGVTMTDFVPSIFNTLVDLAAAQPRIAQQLASLRTVLIGGEEINAQAVKRFRSMLPGVEIVNTYGPTECSIGSVFHTVTDADHDTIPVGRPIDNTYVVILDEHNQLVTPGAVGEICIGGDCVGLGYLNDPGRTAKAFIDNPFEEIPGKLLYRTGDHGRWRDDGCLVFEGRSDQQIKIGGVRVELSEIELAMQAHPDVGEAKVIAKGELDARMLIAFVNRSTEATSPVTEAILREHARATLPPYLVPTRFVVLDSMPLTPNGKTDRLALAKMADSSHGAVLDLSGLELEVQGVWHQIVPNAHVGSAESFFDVGGNSLMAQRLALALNARFGTSFTVRDVVQCPTIADQAALLRGDHSTTPALDDMRRDSDLKPDITPAAIERPAGTLRHVLLTGATGFVGAHLLHELLSETDAVAHCLVRADDPDAAQTRIVANLRKYRLWRPDFAPRVRAVPGDLGSPRLGLTPSSYEQLTQVVDVVLHNGAMVNLVREYAAHRKVNVDGTSEVLRFACTGRAKPTHFVSTLSVLHDGGLEASAPAAAFPSDGYSQSKLVGERLMEAAAKRGLPVAIHRLGEIMPHSRFGVPSKDGLVDLLVGACVRLGVTFRSEIALDYLPADQASAQVVAAIRREETGHFHLRQPDNTRLDEVLDAFRRICGLKDVPYTDFLDRLRSAEKDDQDLARVLTLLPAAEDGLSALFVAPAGRYGAERADRLGRQAGTLWAQPTDEVFENYAHAVVDSFHSQPEARI